MKKLKTLPIALLALSTLTLPVLAQDKTTLSSKKLVSNSVKLATTIPIREQIVEGSRVFVHADRLTIRSKDSADSSTIRGFLTVNDELRVVSASSKLKDNYIEVEVISSREDLQRSQKYFVSFKYLSNGKKKIPNGSKYFMIQNLASEKLRVYERGCTEGTCAHKLVLETDMVVGEKTRDRSTMTNVGNFNISVWRKFYQTGSYPSWYHDSLPMPPEPGVSGSKWLKKKYLGGLKSGMRGAFGWYTAKLAPNANGQWTHGTIGWGEDKGKFLKMTRQWYMNVFADPRSHGCSRTDNESIAFIRELLEVGSDVIKIYAKEEIMDFTLGAYDETDIRDWEYILTKNGSRKDGQKSDKELILSSNVDPEEIIEEGRYNVDQFPNKVEFIPKDFRCKKETVDLERGKRLCEYSNSHFKIGDNYGNIYGLREQEMTGVFYVDAGLVRDYSHPKALPRGGKRGVVVPEFVNAKYLK